jgi:uncharacterized membrane protein
MSIINTSIDVDVPLRTAYDQWTQFESFPEFMEGVESIRQVTDTRNEWTVEVGGATRQFTTEIIEQIPDRRIAWSTVDGDTGHAGAVSFVPLGESSCRIELDMEVEPEGFIEQLGDKLGFITRRIEADMRRFKTYIEDRGSETGAWRGMVVDDSATMP